MTQVPGRLRSRAERDREVVQRTAELLTSSLSLEELFHALCSLLARFVDASTVFIALKTAAGPRYAFILEDGVVGKFDDRSVSPRSVSARVIESGEPELKRRPEDWSDRITLAVPGIAPAESRISAIWVPLKFGTNVIGVLSVQSPHADAYDEEDLALLRVCALYLSVRIHEAQVEKETAHFADLASTDALTGVPNRRAFNETLVTEWHRATRYALPVSLALIDIDFFKDFNDTYGHVAGDAVLQQVATALSLSVTRPEDCFARYGGEEFVTLLPGTPLSGAITVAERMRRAIFDLGIGHSGSLLGAISASIGVACITPGPASESETLLKAADTALYRAKRSGRNRVVAQNYRSNTPPAYPSGASRQNLPLLRGQTIGSIESQERIRRLLRSARLLTVTGTAGIGKSRQSIEATRRDHKRFSDGIFYVDCSTVADERALLRKLASIVGVPATPSVAPDSAFADVLRGKRALIFLDNCDALDVGIPRYVASMLSQTRDARILATAREPLGIPGEVTFSLPQLTTDETAALLRSLAPNDANPESSKSIAQLCKHLGGLPRAIELAAAQLRSFEPNELRERIPDAQTLGRNAVRAYVEWSYAVLSKSEQRLLERMSVFIGGATADAIGAVAGKVDDLASLVEKTLVVEEAFGDVHRYFVPPAVRSFAAEKLEASGEFAAVSLKHARFFCERARKLDTSAILREPRTNELLADNENLQAALRYTIDGADLQLGAELASALAGYWRETGTGAVGREWLEQLLNCGEDVFSKEQYAHLLLSIAQTDSARTARGCAAAMRAVTLFREIGDEPKLAHALCEASDACNALGELRKAEEYATEALEIAARTGEQRRMADALSGLSFAAHYGGDLPASRKYLEQSLEIYRSIGEDRHVGGQLGNLGDLAAAEGDFDRAVALTRQGLAIFERMHSAVASGWLLVNLGAFELQRGNIEAARPALQRGLELVREAQDDWMTANALDCLARLAVANEEHTRALRLVGYASTMLARLGVPRQPNDKQHHDALVAGARLKLGDDVAVDELERAASMQWADVLDEALAV